MHTHKKNCARVRSKIQLRLVICENTYDNFLRELEKMNLKFQWK